MRRVPALFSLGDLRSPKEVYGGKAGPMRAIASRSPGALARLPL